MERRLELLRIEEEKRIAAEKAEAERIKKLMEEEMKRKLEEQKRK